MTKIGLIGLGYVGLPLACVFARKYGVVGYDCNPYRVEKLNVKRDAEDMVPQERLDEAFHNGLICTADAKNEQLKACNVYVVAVPTPVCENHTPDLSCLKSASELVGSVISKGDYVVYESTVYPGLTEEYCLPIIEKVSGLKLNEDFYAGYSPERINPKDSVHTVETVCKITSGSTPEAADFIDNLYSSVLGGGTYKASSMKVAEAAKVMENTQRDVNIALMNEFAIIFGKLGIDTHEVVEAANTKWNALRFVPGLVGGHCIGVDPYYLIQKAEQIGISPRLMIEARNLNESMGNRLAMETISLMNKKGILVKDANVLLLGFSFKENCPDTRNTKVESIYRAFAEYTDNITVLDPVVDAEVVKKVYNIDVCTSLDKACAKKYDAIVLCVKHDAFSDIDIRSLMNDKCVVYDVKGALDRDVVTKRL
jgi:UDP-N-acetyl-D-galactosamine dehydrogenase